MIYTKQELEEFLIALDSELRTQHRIIIIGGAAATLHYQSKSGTVDIDTYNSIEALRDAYHRTKRRHPSLQIPFNAAGPAQGPIEMESRLEAYDTLPLEHLQIMVPEVHDWVLLKAVRCDEKDIADIVNLSKYRSLNEATLKRIFAEEMLPYNPASDEKLIDGYLYVISVLFGEEVADKHHASLQK